MNRALLLYFVISSIATGAVHHGIYAQGINFTDYTDSSGIINSYNAGVLGGGVSFMDFDGDGIDDISLPSGVGEDFYCFRNNNGVFSSINALDFAGDSTESKTLMWADYDNDGDKDLFVGNRYAPNNLYRNDGGNSFTNVSAVAGLSPDSMLTYAACWGDINKDGWIDLYVTTRGLVASENLNYLYTNNGDGTVTEIGLAAGVQDTTGAALAVSFLDYNNDGWPDIYVANDKQAGNKLYENNGNETFTDVTTVSGSELFMDAMGLATADVTGNGYDDIYISNGTQGNKYLLNNGDGTFQEVADTSGIAVNKVCWGVNFFDAENDGDLDLIVSVSQGPTDGINVLYENDGAGNFTENNFTGMENDTSASFGNAIGDVNGDGYYDIIFLNGSPSAVKLWKNTGGDNNWIRLALQGTLSNRDAIGAKVRMYIGSNTISRTIRCGVSFCSQNTFNPIFGLGNADMLDSMVIEWPSGLTEHFYNTPANQNIKVIEDSIILYENAPVGIASPLVVLSTLQISPNPFSTETRISINLGELDLNVNSYLKIYDLSGRIVRSWSFSQKHAIDLLWNGSNDDGHQLPTGTYICKFSHGTLQASKPISLIR